MPHIEGTGPSAGKPAESPNILPEPLTGLEAERTRGDAIHSASERAANPVTSGVHGRVEEETRQLTERLSREERARRRSASRPNTQSEPADVPLPSSPAETAQRLPASAPVGRILVALDGSLYSERALPYAEALARVTDAQLVVGYSTDRVELARLAGTDPSRATNEPIARTLKQARDRIVADGITATARIVYGPDAAEGIVALGREVGADVTAVATHGRQGVDRALLGSVADTIARQAGGYTLVVSPRCADVRDKRVTFSRILAPLDGSSISESSLALATTLLSQPEKRRPRRLTLLFVAETHAEEADGAAYLHDILEALETATGVKGVVFTKVIVGSPPGAIVAEAGGAHTAIPAVARYDLTMMATHGRGGVGRWFYGSVATYVLSHSDTPVLLARPQ